MLISNALVTAFVTRPFIAFVLCAYPSCAQNSRSYILYGRDAEPITVTGRMNCGILLAGRKN